jgi:hypothetical protein
VMIVALLLVSVAFPLVLVSFLLVFRSYVSLTDCYHLQSGPVLRISLSPTSHLLQPAVP